MTSFAFMPTSLYDGCVCGHQHDCKALADLQEALAELARAPSHNSKLQTHHMKERSGRQTFISYFGGSKGRRLFRERINRTIVLLHFGKPDIEQRPEGPDYEIDEDSGGVRIVEYQQRVAPMPRSASAVPLEGQLGSLFMAWTDKALNEFGFAAHEVPVLPRMDGDDALLPLRFGMARDSFDRATHLQIHGEPRSELELATLPASRPHLAPIAPEELADALAQPMGDWIIFDRQPRRAVSPSELVPQGFLACMARRYAAL